MLRADRPKWWLYIWKYVRRRNSSISVWYDSWKNSSGIRVRNNGEWRTHRQRLEALTGRAARVRVEGKAILGQGRGAGELVNVGKPQKCFLSSCFELGAALGSSSLKSVFRYDVDEGSEITDSTALGCMCTNMSGRGLSPFLMSSCSLFTSLRFCMCSVLLSTKR
jgi:hypothetical protein